MSEVKRGALQSPADTPRTTDTIVRHVQPIDSEGNVIGESKDGTAYESVTVDATVGGVALTSGTYGDATRAEMTLEVAQIRVRKDGTGPTASEGHIVEEGDTILLESAADIANFKAIRTGGTSGVLKVTYSE